MATKPKKLTQFWQELKRRKVVRVIIVYAAAAFVILEAIDIIFPRLEFPDWTVTFVIVLLAIGFPFAIIFSWIFDITPKGIKKTEPVELAKEQREDYSLSDILPKQDKSIAVLPFVDMSPQKDQEYFCDGLAEELINALAHVKGLHVAARTSAFSFKGEKSDIQEIGKKLKVKTILEGSVRKSGNKLRITAQLIKVTDGYHLWSEKYDRELEDVFAIQDEISLAIIDNLKVKLLGEEKATIVKRHTENLEAYNLYLKGMFFLRRRYKEEMQKAMECFKEAIEKDPAYALAYVGLADCLNLLGFNTYIQPKKAFPEAKALAQRALEIDDTLSEAHASLGFVRLVYEWDWVGAEKELKRAIELNPMYATGHLWYSYYLRIMGRTEECLSEIKLAQQLEPFSVLFRFHIGLLLFWARQYKMALDKALEVLEMDPDFGWGHFLLGVIYEHKKMYKEAIVEWKKAINILEFSYMGPWLGHTYAISGNKREVDKINTELNELSKKQYISSFPISAIYVALKDKDQAFKLLEKAYENRDSWLVVMIKVDPRFDNLRSDSRYIQLLMKLGLDK